MIEAVAPIVACLILGKALTKIKLFDDIHWPSLEKVMFWIFLPLLIFRAISQGSFDFRSHVTLAYVFFFAQVIMVMLAIVHSRIGRLPNKSMTSLFQSAARWNNVIPIAIVATLFGVDGMAYVAVALAVMVPVANISCIIVMKYKLTSESPSAAYIFVTVLKNPLIIACICGFAANIYHINIPAPVIHFIDIFASATLGVGLLAVGAGTTFLTLSNNKLHIFLATLSKLILMPFVTICLCLIFGITGLELTVAAICTAAPTAMQGYIVARNMGGDSELMALLISSQHILSILTIPTVILVVQSVS